MNASSRELDRVLDALFERYHYDFRSYSRSSIARRVGLAASALGCGSLSELRDRVAVDARAAAALLAHLSIGVSDLFRDPAYFRRIREDVLPILATYPFLRIWVAGCATGEEAYSLAILLQEAGRFERSLLYATDIDAQALARARSGVYPLERIRHFSASYFAAGGQSSLCDHYTTAYGGACFAPELRAHIHFCDHSLATDAAFAEVQLVSCRNVLIYFDRPLQDRAFGLFHDALCPRGFLGLGMQESPAFSSHSHGFTAFAGSEHIYRRS